MILKKVIRTYNYIKIFLWFSLLYILWFIVESFSYGFDHETPILQMLRLVAITLSTAIFSYGLIHIINDIRRGGLHISWKFLKEFFSDKS